jgi:hypothetical protein
VVSALLGEELGIISGGNLSYDFVDDRSDVQRCSWLVLHHNSQVIELRLGLVCFECKSSTLLKKILKNIYANRFCELKAPVAQIRARYHIKERKILNTSYFITIKF